MKTIETIQSEFQQGMAHIPAAIADMPVDAIRQETLATLRVGRYAYGGDAKALFVENTRRFENVGNILFDNVIEPLGLARRRPGEPKLGLVISYGKGSCLAEHDDRYLDGQFVRLAYNLSGDAIFHSTTTGTVDIFTGDLLAQNLARGVRHGVVRVKSERIVALWDIPTHPIFIA